jgi:hypothetical protein
VGGYDGEKALAVNEEYMPSRDDGTQAAWASRAPMPDARRGCSAAVAVNLVHVFGGTPSTDMSVGLKYNVRTDGWEFLEPLPGGPRRTLGLVLLDDHVFAIGGWRDGYLRLNEQYQATFSIVVPIR